MRPIIEIAEKLGLDTKTILPYGHYKAKIPLNAIRPQKGKLIVVTGISPTPAGEGKTTTTVGLAQGMGRLGVNVAAALREPALGPIFGIKGGGTGGGKALIQPDDEVNIHFTGDAHAVGSAHSLLAALTGLIDGFDPTGITWRRVIDVEDRALRSIVAGLGGSGNMPIRESGFDIVTASEVMAILALTTGLENLRARLSRIVVGFTKDRKPVTAADVNAVGSMMALLRTALMPNLVQTSEGQPVFIHAGPFGNIAHGCSSVLADQMALGYADYVLTEAGFGADLGFEKFMHIKVRGSGLQPAGAVLVASVRALKSHGGVSLKELDTPNPKAVREGMANLTHLIGVVRSFGLPVVVAMNHFPTDTAEEIKIVQDGCKAAGAHSAPVSKVFEKGGEGALELGEALMDAVKGDQPKITYMHAENASIQDKVLAVAKAVYNADGVNWAPTAARQLQRYEELGWGTLPVCMAKTHLSLSHDPTLKGLPKGYTFEVSDVRASVGAGFIYPIAGTMMTMPGLPGSPRALDVDAKGNITGL
ncbi:MAG: formate--tetrahydrofolate ligase [Chloroflexi bacterium]|nr:formate--tetrahydrofolate ligase [Chloroflexota bacterium]